ncbi:MAG: hypothetical protein A2W23_05045 [Planctomycetes bacterium RBG_16_43_13]|nr:MAG: hypothetical protein A2W23_05045 [Planctomycetes bacterium RBG_16_43_13]
MPSNEYWAGFFDGEGSVSIHNGLRMNVAIAQKKTFVLELAKKQFGGSIYSKNSKITNPCSHWKITKKSLIVNFLEAIYPYSIVKKTEIEIGLRAVKLIRDVNVGCNPLTQPELIEREKLRMELQDYRPAKNFRNLQSEEAIYRNSIKEKYAYRCSECDCDLKDKSPFFSIVSDDRLFCRKCSKNRNARELKVLSKEQIVDATQKTKNLDDAAKILGISRQGLLRKRRKYGLLEYLCQICQRPFQPTQRASKRYCSDECGVIGKQYLLEQRQTAYHGQKILNNRKYYQNNKEKIKEKLRSKKYNLI